MRHHRITRETARETLVGPCAPIRTTFTPDGRLDFTGICNQIDHLLAVDAKAVLLTYGDSLLSLLDRDEIRTLTKLVAEQIRGRACFVAATEQWHTGTAVEFSQYCRAIGCDMVMVLPPDWGQSCTHESLIAHFQAISEVLPVMLVTSFLRSRDPAWSVQLIDRVMEHVPGVVALKEDVAQTTGRQLAAAASPFVPVMAGGQKVNHLNLLAAGASSYFSVHLLLEPSITRRYWHHIENGELGEARAIAEQYDKTLFQNAIEHPKGFDAVLRGMLELRGFGPRFRRPPYADLDDDEMEQLADFIHHLYQPSDETRFAVKQLST